MDDRSYWEVEAENWVRWARTEGHDAYWYYRDSFFDSVLPPPGRATLEVGCGEGRVTRDLVARGHRVLSVDGSMTLLRHAVDLDPSRRYVLSDAPRLPIATASLDQAVAYNSLMDFDDMPGAVAEVARVLERGATFSICITHPMLDAGGFEGDADDAPYLLRTLYFGSRPFEDTAVKGGITMRFRGWSHALQDYFGALSAAGFVVDALREPVPRGELEDYRRWNRYPMFLHLRAVKR